jgi:hypothetical protein
MKYVVLDAQYRGMLATNVESHLDVCWELNGGVSVVLTNSGLLYFQAMSKARSKP